MSVCQAPVRRLIVVFAIAALAGCGGSSSGTAPSDGGGSGGGPPGTTITIANNAVSPTTITVVQGTQVTFVNNDSRPHDMQSDPHPEHTDCPELASVGFLNPGQKVSLVVLLPGAK